MGIVFVGIPFYTLTKYRGMAEAVRVLRNAGIVDELKRVDPGLVDLGDVNCPVIERDSGSARTLNLDAFLEGTRRVREKLSRGLDKSRLTFCLGGECSFVPGSLAALKDIHGGRPGMVWMDAHGDFNTPETSPSGFIGGMPLALACGRGPVLPGIEESRPLLREQAVVHVGSRALDPGEKEALLSRMKVFSAQDAKRKGMAEVARETVRVLEGSCDWIVAHLDMDVLDPSVMPAINYPEPGGLTRKDVLELFQELHKSGKLRAIDVTAYNPSRDTNNKGMELVMGMIPEIVHPA